MEPKASEQDMLQMAGLQLPRTSLGKPTVFFLLVEVGGGGGGFDPVHYVPSLSQRPVYIYLCLDQCIFQALMLSLRDFQGWLYKSAG
jgi:hypothetical protein